jgi:hypothetical protein
MHPTGSGGLGERLLRQMSLGLQDTQNDVDVRTTTEWQSHKYAEQADGYLVDRASGKAAAGQKYAYDDLYQETDIAYDKTFDDNGDYLFASEVAGFVNVRVEAFGDRDANEHNAAQRKRQEKLLIDEHKTRLIAFKDRALELEKLREARRQIEQVRARLETIHHRAFRPTTDRWYWLGSMTGTAIGRPTVPYWLVTEYIYAQYLPGSWRRDRFGSDGNYFQARNTDHIWVTTFLAEYNARMFQLISLTAEQLEFASNVYLAFRDSAFSQLLQLKGTGNSRDREYFGLLATLEFVKGTVAKALQPDTIARDAVTHDEVDPRLGVQLRFPQAAAAPPLQPTLGTSRPIADLFRELISGIPPAIALVDDPAKNAAFVRNGIELALDRFMHEDVFPSGLSPLAFTGTIDLLNATVMSDLLGAPSALKFFELLRGTPPALEATIGPITLKYTPFGAGLPEKDIQRALAFALLCAPDASGTLGMQSKPPEDGETTATFTVLSGAAPLFDVTLTKLSSNVVEAILDADDAFLRFWNETGISIIDPHYVTQAARLVLVSLFWNILLPTKAVQEAILYDLEVIVRTQVHLEGANAYSKLRQEFDKRLPFRIAMRPKAPTLASGAPVPVPPPGPGQGFQVLLNLRRDFNLAAHFVRELFRSTFAEKYDRNLIDKALLLPAGVPIPDDEKAFTFVSDVRFSADVIDVERLPAPLPPPPPAVALPDPLSRLFANPPQVVPLRLNDPVFFETWEKLYANLFYQNENEADAGVVAIKAKSYWRPFFRNMAENGAWARPDQGAIAALWNTVIDSEVAGRYLTARQRRAGGTVTSLSNLELKLTEGVDLPDNPAALEYEGEYRAKVALTALETTPVPALGILLQAMLVFEQSFYPNVQGKLDQAVANLVDKQQKMLDILHSALTNDPTLALDELKRLAAATYLPDPRFHMQAKFTGRFKFSAQFLTAVRAAYTDLQNLARLSDQARQVNGYGRRPRPLPYDYSALGGVPMDVLTCNTDSANGTRDYIDMQATDPGVLTQLRSCMAAMVAQHIFSIRLDAPDEYKSVVQHQRSPQQLKAAQQAMTQFVFDSVGAPGQRAWRVTFS